MLQKYNITDEAEWRCETLYKQLLKKTSNWFMFFVCFTLITSKYEELDKSCQICIILIF